MPSRRRFESGHQQQFARSDKITTIAYKDGLIAFDSRVTWERGQITVLDYNKSRKVGPLHFFCAGSTADIDELVVAYCSGDTEDFPVNDAVAFVVDQGKLYLIGINDEGHLWRDPYALAQHSAIGSGGAHALTAMDLGCDARKAVKMAMLRDSHTGGKIRTYRIRSYKAKK